MKSLKQQHKNSWSETLSVCKNRFIFETTTEITCSELTNRAFASHVASGVCDLLITDLIKILTAIHNEDIGSPEQNATTEAIRKQC